MQHRAAYAISCSESFALVRGSLEPVAKASSVKFDPQTLLLLVNICNATLKNKLQGSRSQRRYQKQAEQLL